MVLGGLVVAGTGLYLARLAIARDVLSGWLRDRGVQSDLSFDTFGLGGLSGAMRVGPTDKPALTVDRMEVDYRWGGFWSGDPFGLQVRSVRLIRPILHGTWTDKGLSLGPLDRVIAEVLKNPPPEHQPAVKIEDGLMVLASPYGALEVHADAELAEGKLVNLDARSSATRLVVGDSAFALGPGGLTVHNKADRLEALFQVYVAEAQAHGLSGKAVNVRLAAQAPYPDLKTRRADGPVALRLVLSGDEIGAPNGKLTEARVEARFDGRLAGPVQELTLTGSGQVEGAAASGAGAGATVRALRLTFDAPEVAWTRKGGDRFTGRYEGALKAAELTQAALRLRNPKLDLKASGVIGPSGSDLQLRGSGSSRGGWSGLGPVLAADDPETAALKTALADFDLTAPNFALNLEGPRLAVSLPAPMTIRTRSGGAAVLAAVRGQPVFAGGGGRFALATRGGGLPDATLVVDRFTAVDGVIAAQTRLAAKGSFGPAHDGTLTTNGLVRISGGGLRYSISTCSTLAAEHLELGANDIEKLSAQVCPAAAPLISTEGGALRLRANVREAGATSPFLQMRGEGISAAVDIRLKGGGAYGQAQLAAATVEDMAPQRRFYPVVASGPIKLDVDHVTADLAVADRAGHGLARGVLDHDLSTGRGGLTFDTGQLVFADGGLQPAAISPLAAPIASPAQGQAAFKGALAWDAKGLTSQGDLTIARLDFKSPAGPVAGLAGAIAFDSLVPLKTAPGQTLTAQRVDVLGQLTNASATFGLDESALHLDGLSAEVGGGAVRVGKLDVPFDPKTSWSGQVDLTGVQVDGLVKASPFGDKVSLDARLSGKLPFTVTPQGVRITGGELHAVQPGTLSIQRAALTGVQAQTEVGTDVPGVPKEKPVGPSENLVADFAYQALEHLAFETLAAQVDSLPQGRLGVNFQIKGEFKPPQHQELWLGYLEAVRGTYMDKQLPLPSNTKVDLSLDTSVNLDQLLADYGEYQRLRGSGPVQP